MFVKYDYEFIMDRASGNSLFFDKDIDCFEQVTALKEDMKVEEGVK